MTRFTWRMLLAAVASFAGIGISCAEHEKPSPASAGAARGVTPDRIVTIADPMPPATSGPASGKSARAGSDVAKSDPIIDRIREEGLNHSQVMDTLSYLCDVIGPRLTGSPACRRANEWTRDTLTRWGLTNAHLESWGPFGRGWEVRRFSLQITEPYPIVLHGYPRAWSPGFDVPIEAPVVLVDATRADELDKYKDTLSGAIVLLGAPRDVEARFEPLANRMTDQELERLAGAIPGSSAMMGQPRAETAAERRAQFAASGSQGEALMNRRNRNRAGAAPGGAPGGGSSGAPGGGSNGGSNGGSSDGSIAMNQAATQPTSRPARGGRRRFDAFSSRALQFVADEGAALIITPSTTGDGGTIFVAAASIPGDAPFGGFGGGPTTSPTTSPTTNPMTVATIPTTSPALANAGSLANPTTAPTTRPRVWAVDAPSIPPQVTLAVEDYNRLARMIRRGQKLTMSADIDVRFTDDDPFAYNTIAEIPGTDLKDQVVMVGAHLDSWHSGTGATDNAVGSAAAMETVRIIRALNLHPRRTIRVALWTGEEQGIFGSAAYVKKHFGYDPDANNRRERMRRTFEMSDSDPSTQPATQPTAMQSGAMQPATQPASRLAATEPASPRKIVKEADYEKLSVYFNLDNGTGKIRGIYAQGNDAAVPIFKSWLAYFHDLGATTVTLSNTGSTDHVSFDQVGLPGFQFIQDPIEYGSRTHHSNEDVYDRIQADDMKQASTIMAAFVWKAANMDDRFPRKPLDRPESR